MEEHTIIPRPEHPKPQFQREQWINLNGRWTYAFDFGRSGINKNLHQSQGFEDEIMVPFCPESPLSQVGHTDFIEMMWYHRQIEIPADWQQRVLLHFGAVDFQCEIFVDGTSIDCHYGGSSSFFVDITDHVKAGESHHLVVMVQDYLRSGTQTGGKQCPDFKSRGCHYTRTTGIWQTVWMEHVSEYALKRCRIVPDYDHGSFDFQPEFHGIAQDNRFRVTINAGEDEIVSAECRAVDGVILKTALPDAVPWSPENPFLYDILFEVLDVDGNCLDLVKSYAGLRKIHIEGNQVLLNNEPLYLRLVLDQGFYPDGIWTAPTDEALKKDIILAQQAGFNGARLHQKVFEERFHYWADKLGYLTWGESASWGLNFCYRDGVDANAYHAMANFSTEWREVVLRDQNHPSIIAWTPFNETRHASDWQLHRRYQIEIYELTKALDPTRPVNDASGYVHERTDLYTIHNYEQDPGKLADVLALDEDGKVWRNFPDHDAPYQGQPYIIDEFGGIKWIPESRREYADNSWGYGEGPKSLDEFYQRLAGQVKAIEACTHICGFCYTQLTDVEQEENGIYNYDRSEKFDMAVIKEIFS